MTNKKAAKSALESLMFVWGDLLSAEDAAQAIGITKAEALACLQELSSDYEREERGIRIKRVGDAFQFVTRPENADYIRKLCTPVKTKRLSQAALEVLAIIAYRQPVSKPEIDSIRGIKSDRVLEGLLAKDLIRDQGRAEGIGRPMLYGTTQTFLKQFGFRSLKDLPKIEDIAGEPENRPDWQLSIADMQPEER